MSNKRFKILVAIALVLLGIFSCLWAVSIVSVQTRLQELEDQFGQVQRNTDYIGGIQRAVIKLQKESNNH